jgi:hypothetical protein
MALRIPAVEGKDELTAFQQQVIRTADAYGKKHNLCSVLDQALADLGLSRADLKNTQPGRVRVKAAVELELDLVYSDISEFAGMSPSQERAKVAKLLDDVLKKAKLTAPNGQGVTIDKDFTAELKVESVDPGPTPQRLSILDGGLRPEYKLAFTGPEGRVSHIVSGESDTWGYVYSACGVSSYDGWPSTSSRDEGRVCAQCERKANNNADTYLVTV